MRIRTGYAFRSAVGHLNEVVDKVESLGWGVAPISDRSSTFGWVNLSKAVKKRGLKPIFGVELAVTDSIHAKKPAVSYWSFFAKRDILDINRLINTATNQFRYEPLLTYQQAKSAHDVIKIVGHESLMDQLSPVDFDDDPDLFVGLSPSASRGFLRSMKERHARFIATSDNKYTNPGDTALYEVICGRGASTQSYAQHILTDDEWSRAVMRNADPQTIAGAVANRAVAFSLCHAELRSATLLSPAKPMSLRMMCEQGAAKLGTDLTDPVYRERLDRELSIIDAKNFEDYFFIIADIMQFARARMICGPARGSSCGSLVCYLLEITTIDPIPFGLMFERFIDLTRADLPDIDLDFSKSRRELVFEYVRNKYGADHVGRLGAVATYKSDSAINEASAALKIPKWKTSVILDSIVKRKVGDSMANKTIEEVLYNTDAGKNLLKDFPNIEIAMRMESHPRHYSQHAAGIVLTQETVLNYAAVDARSGVVMCDKYDAESLNLLKIDALGLTQLSVFEYALELAGLPRLHLESVPLDDQNAFDVLNQKKWSGVFQFNGPALKSLAGVIKADNIEDIISITALARPGPMASGGAEEWTYRRNGSKPVVYPHPVFRPYLEQTLGIVIYQEQVLKIGREIGNLSWEEVTGLRKAMSKSLGKEYFDQFGIKWKAGAAEKGVPQAIADRVWDDLCSYGSWAFNRSHSVAYGIISYWCCWMKAYYPHEFAAATLTYENMPDKQIQLLRELDAEGIEYVPLDPLLSTDKWIISNKNGEKILVGPVTNVKGIGPKMVNSIISCRARGEPMSDRAMKLIAGGTTPIDSLWPIRDEFNRIMPDPSARNIYTQPTQIAQAIPTSEDQSFLFFCVFSKLKVGDENEPAYLARRGYEIKGKTTVLRLCMKDDTGIIHGRISRFDFDRIGKPIVDRGSADKALYAIRGVMRANAGFPFLMVENVRFVGMIGQETRERFEEGKLENAA